MKNISLFTLSLCVGLVGLRAQSVVPVGEGSYASSVPASEGVDPDGQPVYVLDGNTEPVPTNDWWTPLILKDMYADPQYHLWAHPLDFTVNPEGLGVHFATEWSGGQDINKTFVIPAPVLVGGEGFTPDRELVKEWGDWTVAFRMLESSTEYVDVTIGHGLPFAWLEYRGVTTAQVSTDGAKASYNDAGETQAFPFTGDHFGFTWQGRDYGVFAPGGTEFSESGGTVSARFGGDDTYLIVSAMPAKDDLALFYRHAYALPRNTTVAWDYSEGSGTVETTWSLETEVLKGNDNGVLQGFLPHHLKYTDLGFGLTDVDYATARGRVRVAGGNDFKITYNYDGVLTHQPAPEVLDGKSNNYDAGRMADYFSAFSNAEVLRGEANTYTSGKSLTKFARFIAHADVLGNENKATYQTKLEDALADWFTYTPGEPYSYYAYLPKFKGLLGFETGYGSEGFNDHHFHYGYHVYAAGVLGMQDRSFIEGYGEIATEIAKEYANWDRDDKRYPFLRNFDPWSGHSWANGGYGMNPPVGNNQESTSEAMMSWTGLIQLGLATGNRDMLSAGAFGFVSEAAATNEYWFDRDDENLPPGFGPDGKIACILGGSNVEYQTFFGLNPIYVHGIQYIPVMPSSYYLMQNSKFDAAQREFDYLRTRSVAQGYGDIGEWGTEWDNIALRYASLFDPEWSIENFSALSDDAGEAGLSYYQVYSNRTIGRREFDLKIGAANSGVFYNPETETYTYCVFNPTGSERQCNVYQNGSAIGSITAPPNQFFSTNSLDGDVNPDPNPDPDPDPDPDPNPDPDPDSGEVTLFVNCPFDGGSITLGEGEYTAADLSALGFPDNSLSSLRVKDGWRATLYRGDNFQGESLEVTSDDDCVVNEGFNDSMTSIRVAPAGGGPDQPPVSGCDGDVNEDFGYTVGGTASAPTLTFNAERDQVGDGITILYYSTQESGLYPGYTVTPGEPFSINAPAGSTVYFYYTYSVPEGGERNTIDDKRSFVVGECADLVGRQFPDSDSRLLRVYPNPTSQRLNVVVSAGEVTEVTVYDLTGRKQAVPARISEREITLATTSLAAGAYRVQVRTATQTLSRSFLKQ